MTQLLTPTLNDVTRAFHDIFPPALAEKWDAAGLVVGRSTQTVTRVGFAVDATVATAREAAEQGAGLLITHHPLLLRGASFLPDTDYKGEIVHTLIEAGCGLLGAHTNVDSAPHGTNEVFMAKLGLTDTDILTGETTVQIEGQDVRVGIGRVGSLPAPVTLKELAEKIADFLPATAGGLRIAGRPDQMVQKIALCTGAGDSLFGDARTSGADVYITADLRHHPASEAREQALISGGTPALIDCSHYASEWLWMDGAARLLTEKLAGQGFTIDTYVSTLNTDPWDFTVSTGQVAGSASTR
ncbi:Nif3-like dinuclear metal center hexameric protein [Rothia nasimurium]|uniref:Nif3-like dinuclear metal center hexameric protein n=1 Tax=Rothia nasimurium TaxID=85336 RepID=UPI001F0049CF|nr:Nif3-like dinuclear metal center hexameric protein [Rothia nasimurium]